MFIFAAFGLNFTIGSAHETLVLPSRVVAAYGNLTLERIKDLDFDVKCISFNHKIALEFPPDILGDEILKFIIKTNKIRKTFQLSALKTRENMNDLEKEIKKFIS